MNAGPPHICICVCTYQRPPRLAQLLEAISRQQPGDKFTLSLVVVDNDCAATARSTVERFRPQVPWNVVYEVEAEQSIALARNRAVHAATGDLIAFIDDDEFPPENWLSRLLDQLVRTGADGVLGPVKPHFDQPPPQWVLKGRFCDRPSHPTGTVLDWKHTRTGNVLLRREALAEVEGPFRREFGSGGEDRDFFRRSIEKGRTYVWCEDAAVYEHVPPERLKISFLLKRALLRGQVAAGHPAFGPGEVAKSILAVVLYTPALLVMPLLGKHVVMKYLIKESDHLGKLLATCGIRPIRQKYIIE